MKYIFIAGAPGSKWSSVAKNIYHSASIDRSDSAPTRQYFRAGTDSSALMHLGAYWDPGMEFGSWFDHPLDGFGQRTKSAHEAEFNRPFSGQGVRIIKSHYFCHADSIEFLRQSWPDSPIVLVSRSDDACLGWWTRSGHFDIHYPNYQWYQNFARMAQQITLQNTGIVTALAKYPAELPANNHELARILNIDPPPTEYQQDYAVADVRVAVI